MDATAFLSGIMFPPKVHDCHYSALEELQKGSTLAFMRKSVNTDSGTHTVHLISPHDVIHSIESDVDLYNVSFVQLTHTDEQRKTEQWHEEPTVEVLHIPLTDKLQKGERLELAPPTGVPVKQTPWAHMNVRYTANEEHVFKINGVLIDYSEIRKYTMLSDSPPIIFTIGGKPGRSEKGCLIMD